MKTDLAMLFGLAAIWGASFLFIKVAVLEMSPLMLVALRLSLASVGLLAAQPLLQTRSRTGAGLGTAFRSKWRAYLYMALMNAIVPYTLIAWGEERIASGTTSILNATTPLWTALIAALLLRGKDSERLTPARAAGLLVGFAGVAVLVFGRGGELAFGTTLTEAAGEAAVLVAAAAYGVSGLYGRTAFAGLSPTLPATWQNVFGAVVLLPLAWLLTPLETWPSWQATWSVLTLGILGTAVALLVYYHLLARVGATRTLVVTYLLPCTALVYGVLFLNEKVGLYSLLGLALVLAGVMTTSRASAATTVTNR